MSNPLNTNIGIIQSQHQAATFSTQGGANVYNATLKGKINGLEETVQVLTEELNFYKQEISQLTDEKNQLEENLAKKTYEIRTTLLSEVRAADENMKASYQAQKQENQRMQNAITTLKTEKTNLNQHLLDLKRRVSELELMIGDENN